MNGRVNILIGKRKISAKVRDILPCEEIIVLFLNSIYTVMTGSRDLAVFERLLVVNKSIIS